jgi:aspartyl-tRNA(Asn)/glutamyl-tRNA(Gln) amidotransferase subunit A
VPLALGTQTAGSVNRPAAYCGVGAFKPSTLAIGGAGMVPLAPSFDTVGAFGFTAADAAWLATGYAPAHLRMAARPGGTSRIVVLRDPSIERMADAETAAGVAALAARLSDSGLEVVEIDSPVSLDEVRTQHRVALLAEAGRTHGRLPAELLAPRLAADIAAGLAIPDADYWRALHALAMLRQAFWPAFGPADLLLLPAAPAVAPVGMATGDPSFVVPLTALGGPVATLRAWAMRAGCRWGRCSPPPPAMTPGWRRSCWMRPIRCCDCRLRPPRSPATGRART